MHYGETDFSKDSTSLSTILVKEGPYEAYAQIYGQRSPKIGRGFEDDLSLTVLDTTDLNVYYRYPMIRATYTLRLQNTIGFRLLVVIVILLLF